MKKKKQVPEWMNSALWSTPSDHGRFDPPSPPPPPPVSVKEDSRTIPTNQNSSPPPFSSSSVSSPTASADDISRQAQAQAQAQVQLLAEVSFLTHSFTCLELLVYVVVVFRYSYLGR